MNYYKLIDGMNFLGIVTSQDMRRFQKKHNIILICDESEAQYVQLNGDYYRDDWMLPSDENLQARNIQIIQIDKEEYDILYEAIENGEEIETEPEYEETEQPQEEVDTDNVYEATLEYIMESKIKEMSNTCNHLITNGFDIELSDGETHHFSLTIQDQLNLITLSSLVSAGETEIPYHADGELCKFYSPVDIISIVAKATEFKTYQVTYYNSLKAYIESLDNIEDISRIEYGVEIPTEYQSEILKGMLANAQKGQ